LLGHAVGRDVPRLCLIQAVSKVRVYLALSVNGSRSRSMVVQNVAATVHGFLADGGRPMHGLVGLSEPRSLHELWMAVNRDR
jgi:hypothetical protein